MSTNPEDQLVNVLSHWLARHVDDDELRALASEGVQSLLLEGGMKLAAAFLRADLVDKMMMFVSPRVAGKGTTFTPPRWLGRLTVEQVGDDVLQTGYVHEP